MEYKVPISGWPKGVDNVHADFEVPPDALMRGVNINILDSGKVRRRGGHTLATAMSDAHSLWSDGVSAYYIRNNTLYKYASNGVSTNIGTFNSGANRAAYVKVDADVYVTSKTARAKIKSGAMALWGVETPSSPPVVAATSGILPVGDYFVACTFLDAAKQESGASSLAKIALTSTGGVVTTALPIPTNPAATLKRLYMSTTDGEVLYMVAEVAAAAQFVSISTLPSGVELRTEHVSPPPFGVLLAYFNGRIFIVDAADPTIVWHTEANAYGHVKLRKNYYKFEAPVTMIVAVDDGLYVASEQTWFIAGAGSAEASQRLVLESGAVFGSAASIPDTTDAIWMSDRGAVIGKSSGVVEVLSGKQVSTGGMIDAAAMVREQNSIRQYVVVGSGSEASALQAGSYAEAEIIRQAA